MINRFDCCNEFCKNDNMDLTPSPYSRETPVAPLPGDDNYPVIPLPPIMGENGPSTPVIPLPPIVDDSGANIPVIPLPPIVDDSGANIPVIPLPPIVSNPGVNMPVIPLPPIISNPGNNFPAARYCMVRFLHAAPNSPTMNISIGSRRVATNLAFGNFSEYTYIPDGFRTVTILSTRSPRSILFQHNIPFQNDSIITLAIINTINGIELTQINDKNCSNRPADMSCLRMSNLVFNGPPLDLLLSDCRVVFSDVRSRETTSFSRIRQGNYGFFVTQTPNYPVPLMEDVETLREMPVMVSERYIPGYGDISALLSFQLNVKRNTMYTIYVLGTMDSPSDIQMLISENY